MVGSIAASAAAGYFDFDRVHAAERTFIDKTAALADVINKRPAPVGRRSGDLIERKLARQKQDRSSLTNDLPKRYLAICA